MGTDIRRRVAVVLIACLSVLGIGLAAAGPAAAAEKFKTASVACASGTWTATVRYNTSPQGSYPVDVSFTKTSTTDGSREHWVQWNNNTARTPWYWLVTDKMRQNGSGSWGPTTFGQGQAYNFRLRVKTGSTNCYSPYVSLN